MIYPLLIMAVLQTWSIGGESTVEAELRSFDFAGKTVALVDEDGREHPVATADLSLQNRVQLLLSREFVNGYPRDHWAPQQTRYVVLWALVPSFYFLFGFWLSAALLLKKANPLSAVIGFVGGWMLAVLLIGGYVMFASRAGDAVIFIMMSGIGVAALFVSVFISVIYKTSTGNGFLVFFCHLFLAVVLMAISSFTVSHTISPAKLDQLMTRHVFVPVGMMAPAANEE